MTMTREKVEEVANHIANGKVVGYLNQLIDTDADHRTQLEAYERERVRLVGANEAWHGRVASLKTDLAAALARVEEITLRRSETIAMCDQLQGEVNTLQQTVGRLEQRIEDERHAHRDTANERNQAEGDIRILKAERDTLAQRVLELEEGLRWPIATGQDKEAGWTHDFKFLQLIQDKCGVNDERPSLKMVQDMLNVLQALPPASNQPKETTMDIDKLVERFLAWPLPDSVCSDLCATKQDYPHRSGTNLLTAVEAKAMLTYLLSPASKEGKETA